MKIEEMRFFDLPNDEATHPLCSDERGRIDPKKVKALLQTTARNVAEVHTPTQSIVIFIRKTIQKHPKN